MAKITKRQRRLAAKKYEKKNDSKFREIEYKDWSFVPKGLTRAYANDRFIVMVYDNTQTNMGPATKALVQKHDGTIIRFHWSEMQRIKNEIFGKDVTAIEYYPAQSNLIDDYNIYWMWVFPDGVIPIWSPE